jgi:hypothetical protein
MGMKAIISLTQIMGQFFSARINPQVPPTMPRQSSMDKESTMHLTHRIAKNAMQRKPGGREMWL